MEVGVFFEECFFDECVVLFGGFVLKDCDFSIDWVVIFADGFILTFDARKDCSAVCYSHYSIISAVPFYLAKMNRFPKNL